MRHECPRGTDIDVVLTIQHLLRDVAPQVLGVVLRRYRDFAACEDAVQEAFIAAATQWPREGTPDNPRAWLIQVACRRISDHVRAEVARRRREALVVSLVPLDEQVALAADTDGATERDDTYYRRAAERTASIAERNYLLMHAAQLSDRTG